MMFKTIYAGLVTASMAAEYDKMGFAFELVRHGARAPLLNEFTSGFSVATGMLTP